MPSEPTERSSSATAAAKSKEGQPSGAVKESDTRFDLLEFEVVGNTVLSALAIEQAVYPFLGENKSIEEVEKARKALEQAYQTAGYLTVFVDIPEQDVKQGVVTLNVAEGRVERVRVTGSRYYSLGRIRSKLNAAAEGTVPYFPEVQKDIASMQAADRKVTPVLKPGRAPGTVQVDLKVEDKKPFRGSVELNNKYSPNTEKLRLALSLSYSNLFQRDHSIGLSLQTAPQDPDQSSAVSLSYILPVEGTRNVVALYGVHSKSNVAALGELNVVGPGDIFGVRAILPLRARGDYSHSLTLGMDYKNLGERVSQGGDVVSDKPIRYLPFLAQYGGALQGDAGVTQFDAGITFSLRGLSEHEVECLPGVTADQFECRRFNARSNFWYFKGNLRHTHKLANNWSVFGKIETQLASGPLISNEQYVAGGIDSVRGYLESEASGDNALSGRVELNLPPMPEEVGGYKGTWMALAFVDGAHLELKDALPSQRASFSLSSLGVGLRIDALSTLKANFDVAWPLKETDNAERRQARAHFKLSYDF